MPPALGVLGFGKMLLNEWHYAIDLDLHLPYVLNETLVWGWLLFQGLSGNIQ